MTGQAGRPVSPNRSAALVLGDRTYQGKRCKRCGASERYTTGGACVACQRRHSVESRAALKAVQVIIDQQAEDAAAEAEGLYPAEEPTHIDAAWDAYEEHEAAQPAVNDVEDGFDSSLDSESEDSYLRQDEIPQPWD